MNIVAEDISFSPSELLVILDDDVFEEQDCRDNPLINRSVMLAKKLNCSIELFYLCHSTTPQLPLFGLETFQAGTQSQITETLTSKLAEIALTIESEGIKVTYDISWDQSETDAFLRKIGNSDADIVLKKAPESTTLFGLFDTDLDLVRQSPCHLLFVKDEGDKIDKESQYLNKIVSAVGTQNYADHFICAEDYKVFNVARTLSNKFNAENIPVHAYQTQANTYEDPNYPPNVNGINIPTPLDNAKDAELAREIAEQHGHAISAFLDYFNIKPEFMQIHEGKPAKVIEELARAVHADLVVMSARNLSKWERLTETVTGMTSAGPILSKLECDVFYVKDNNQDL